MNAMDAYLSTRKRMNQADILTAFTRAAESEGKALETEQTADGAVMFRVAEGEEQ